MLLKKKTVKTLNSIATLILAFKKVKFTRLDKDDDN